MPTVPGQAQTSTPSGNVTPMVKPSETDIAIAMATIHQQGRLFPSPLSDNVIDRRGESPNRSGEQGMNDLELSTKAAKVFDDDIALQAKLNKVGYKAQGLAADAGYNDVGKRK